MIKICITVRNRLSITKHCISSILSHTTIPYKIYLYNNLTNHKIDEHFEYFCDLYKKGIISQLTFNTHQSTFNCFSKTVSSNQFGLIHEQDPEKDKYYYLVILDNDMIVMPEWDINLKAAWKYVNKNKMTNIKIITQSPGGMKQKELLKDTINGNKVVLATLGGSGFWSIRPDFFRDVGYLDLSKFVGRNKGHDSQYWPIIHKASKGKKYTLGLQKKLAIHCGPMIGSVCNVLQNYKMDEKNKLEKIKFELGEENISKMNFDEFFKLVSAKNELSKW